MSVQKTQNPNFDSIKHQNLIKQNITLTRDNRKSRASDRKDESFFGDTGDEYDPMRPNDYEKIKDEQKKRRALEANERREHDKSNSIRRDVDRRSDQKEKSATKKNKKNKRRHHSNSSSSNSGSGSSSDSSDDESSRSSRHASGGGVGTSGTKRKHNGHDDDDGNAGNREKSKLRTSGDFLAPTSSAADATSTATVGVVSA